MVAFSTEFWVVFQLVIILLLIILLVLFMRSTKSGVAKDHSPEKSVEQIVDLLDPILKEAESAASVFESQIIEKKQIIKQLNEKLDSRIISLNLLLNRADACLSGSVTSEMEGAGEPAINDVQDSILKLYKDGLDAEEISRQLSVSKKEVDLVIRLKKKFIALEQSA